jgi:hypothetical protein
MDGKAYSNINLLLCSMISESLGADSGAVIISLRPSKEPRQFRSSQLLQIFFEFIVLILWAA